MNGAPNGEANGAPSGEAVGEVPNQFMARREEEIARRDRSLAEFLVMLDGYKPLVSRARSAEL